MSLGNTIELGWADFKNFLTSRNSNLQSFEANGAYHLFAFDGPMTARCLLEKDNGPDHLEFETNFKPSANASPKVAVQTMFEKANVQLQLACATASVNAGTKAAIVSLRVPGSFGQGVGRLLSGGELYIDTFDFNDICTVWLEDVDRNIAWALALAFNPAATQPLTDAEVIALGTLPAPFNAAYPNYPKITGFYDEEIGADGKQGWYLEPLVTGSTTPPVGYNDIESLGYWAPVPSGFYIMIKLQRETLTTGTVHVNYYWGKPT